MAFKRGESDVSKRGKLYPVFLMDDGDMYSLRMDEEQLELFQILVGSLFKGDIKIDKEPLNNGCSYKIINKNKDKRKT